MCALAATETLSKKPTGQIGPNSIIQTVRALKEIIGENPTCTLLEGAGLAAYLEYKPDHMIDEAEFLALAKVLFAKLDTSTLKAVMRRSGNLTGKYVLTFRIPKPVQQLMKFLPPQLRLRLLLKAIGKNAWTFVGSGTYSFTLKPQPEITIEHSIFHTVATDAMLACSYYTGAFEMLINTMVSPKLRIEEVACVASQAEHCTFTIR